MKQVYLLGIILVTIIVVCAGCDTKLGPDTVDAKADWRYITHYWDMAEAELGIYKFKPQQLSWRAFNGPFYCEKVLSNGCFYVSGTIKYDINTPGVIKQEACHAIKYMAHFKDWREGCYSASNDWLP